jgi:hypothetical protein
MVFDSTGVKFCPQNAGKITVFPVSANRGSARLEVWGKGRFQVSAERSVLFRKAGEQELRTGGLCGLRCPF